MLEALRGRRKVIKVMLAERAVESAGVGLLRQAAAAKHVPVVACQRAELDRLVGSIEHQGVAAQVEPFPYVEISEVLADCARRGETPLLLALDSLQDPQNLGSLLRTAEAVGVHVVILQVHRAVEVTSAVVRASAGAVEHLRVARVTNLAQTLQWLKGRGVWIAGLDAQGGVRYDQADLKGPLVLVVGGEGVGVSRLVRERCDFLVTLPMQGAVGSLNAAVAGSIVLFEARRQRSVPRAEAPP